MMRKALPVWLLLCSSLAAQGWAPPPHPTALPSQPFFIRNIWYVGGAGPWNTMTMDPGAGRLYIAHGRVVQVIDVASGRVIGEIRGLYGARAIALDDKGAYGYISDGPSSRVVVFDRHSLETVAAIKTQPDPRSLVYEPLSGLVFVVQSGPPAQPPSSPANKGRRPQPQSSLNPSAQSYITVIDPESNGVLGLIQVSGHLGYAQADGSGEIYVGYTDHDALLHFNAQAVAADLHSQDAKSKNSPAPEGTLESGKKPAAPEPPLIDWTEGSGSRNAPGGGFRELSLGAQCGVPHEFALDGRAARLFVACADMTLEVLNTATGQPVTSLPIGSGVDEIGYDPVHGYIFAADGAGDGNLTIIRRDSATDTYAIVQNVPTRQRAYVMAVDPDSGGVYLITDIVGADLTHAGGIGSLSMKAVNGSFQVIQIGN